MNILIIGGTGTISTDISKQLLKEGHTVYLLNRGTRQAFIEDTRCAKNALATKVPFVLRGCDREVGDFPVNALPLTILKSPV